jgi:hypothetical protein
VVFQKGPDPSKSRLLKTGEVELWDSFTLFDGNP